MSIWARETCLLYAAIQAIHGVTTKCTKGIWYGAGEHIEGFSLHTHRSKQDHKERRKIREKAFTTARRFVSTSYASIATQQRNASF